MPRTAVVKEMNLNGCRLFFIPFFTQFIKEDLMIIKSSDVAMASHRKYHSSTSYASSGMTWGRAGIHSKNIRYKEDYTEESWGSHSAAVLTLSFHAFVWGKQPEKIQPF